MRHVAPALVIIVSCGLGLQVHLCHVLPFNQVHLLMFLLGVECMCFIFAEISAVEDLIHNHGLCFYWLLQLLPSIVAQVLYRVTYIRYNKYNQHMYGIFLESKPLP